MVSILDVKKGARVQLRESGWYATVLDNMCKGHTRLCDVEGMFREMGSVYTTDIVSVQRPDGSWDRVEFTPGQVKAKASRKMAGF